MISRPDESATYHLWDRFAPHSWCVADSHIPFASLLSRSAPQFVIWRGYAGRLIIPKGFSNPPGLYRQDYHSWGFKNAFHPPPASMEVAWGWYSKTNQKATIIDIKLLLGIKILDVFPSLPNSITPGLSGFWDQSQANSPLYIAFWSVEPTDFKNVIVENIPPALSEIDQHAFWNFIENKNDENSIMKSHKN